MQLVQETIRCNPFATRYVSWLDIGLFRDFTVSAPSTNTGAPTPFDMLRPSSLKPFNLYLPPNFNIPGVENSSVAVCEINNRQPSLTPEQIVGHNAVWIGGGFFVGRVDVVYTWTVEFLTGVEWMLQQGLSSTDQQVRWLTFARM
jgi:hypothetical protein